MTTFFVKGKAAAQGSKRHIGRGVMVEMDRTLPTWRKAVATAAKAAHQDKPPFNGPVSVKLVVYVKKPKTTKFKDYPAGPHDLDKLQRAIGDALTASNVISDDARIVHWDAWKKWATPGNTPGAHVTIKEMQ